MISDIPGFALWYQNTAYGDDPVSRFKGFQNYVSLLPLLETNELPGDPNNHEDRWNPESGIVYSWDENADQGKGAWVVNGRYKFQGHPEPGTPGFDAEYDIDWLDKQGYQKLNYGDDFYE